MTSRRIAILTFHAAFNCGARLQAWALQQVLRDFGFEPEFPDGVKVGYVPRFTRIRHRGLSLFQTVVRELGALGFEDVRRWRFGRFSRRHLNVVPVAAGDVERRYESVLVGSDQVWNTGITRLEAGYFLATVFNRPELRCYSYAISLGDSMPPDARIPILSAAAGLFENLSFRENLVPGLRDRHGRPASVDPDPTLLLDRAAFDAVACPRRLVRKPYLLVYSLVYNANTWAAAREMAKRLGLKLVIVQNYQYGLYRLREGAGVRITVSPDRFLAYFRDAAAVITSSFHGTAFSLIYDKPFAVLPNHDGRVPRRSAELLAALDERKHLVDLPTDFAALAAALGESPKPEAHARLARLRAEARDRLRAALPDLSALPPPPVPVSGSAWTWPLRKLRGGCRCLAENGICYTVRHLVGKILRGVGL